MDGTPSDADLTAHATGAHRVIPPRAATGDVPGTTFGWWLVTYRDGGGDDVIEAQLLNANAHWSPAHGPCGFADRIKRAVPLTTDGRPAHISRGGEWSTGNHRASMRTEGGAVLTVRRHHESVRWTATVDVGVGAEGDRPRVTGLVDGSMADAQAWCDRWAAVVLAELEARGE